MVLITSLALAAGMQALPACSWDRPGVNRYTGDLVASVDHYADIPASTRAKLKQRLASPSSYDDHVVITRDAIEGAGRYGASIEGMHFGQGQVCSSVSRASWAATDTQRGLVYCEDGHCLIVPSVCSNLGRVTRVSPPAQPDAPGPTVAAKSPPTEDFDLPTEPTGAGLPPGSVTPELVPASPPGDSFTAKSIQPPDMPLVLPPSVTTAGISPGVRIVAPPPPPPVEVPPVTAVPEPTGSALLLAGIGALAWRRRRGRAHARSKPRKPLAA